MLHTCMKCNDQSDYQLKRQFEISEKRLHQLALSDVCNAHQAILREALFKKIHSSYLCKRPEQFQKVLP